jgi:hypothetical protein
MKDNILTLGSDPELLLIDNEEGGKPVSSIRVLGRDKYDPIPLGDEMKMYADNVLVEAAFPPISLMGDIIGHFRRVFCRMQEKLTGRYSLLPKAAHTFNDDELQHKIAKVEGIRDEDTTAFTIGCTPWYDCYKRSEVNPTPFKNGTRSSSMHIHIGNVNYKTDRRGKLMSVPDKEDAIKIMDIFVGCAAAIFDKDETAQARRDLGYGRCGTFRMPHYGVEYRPLSSYALRHPDLTLLVRDLTIHAMEHVMDDSVRDVIASVDSSEVQTAINTGNRVLARKILTIAGLPQVLFRRVERRYEIPSFNQAWAI